jgi:hypothetical protein
MDNTDENIKKTSMFSYRATSRIEYDTADSRAHASAKSLIEKGVLKNTDKMILDFLGEYEYLNAYMLRCLITGSERGGEEKDKRPLQKTLKALMKTGLIKRFRIVYTDIFCVEHSSPFIYQLGTYRSLTESKEKRKADYDHIITPIEVVSRLAFNQFIITLVLQYMYHKVYVAQNYGLAGTDAQVLMTLKNNNKLGFNIVTSRGNEQWKDTLKKQLTSRPNNFPYIVICESEQAAMEIERYHKATAEIATIGVFYICDYASISGDKLFDQVISVNAVNNYSSYDICSFELA